MGDDALKVVFKVLVIGDYATGKTSIIHRYCDGVFSSNYKITIGVDFLLKNLQWDDNTSVNLQIWDIAGHERFGYLTKAYYKYASAAVVVFDLSRPQSFETMKKWLSDIKEKVLLPSGETIPIMLIGNKSDLVSSDFSAVFALEFVKEEGLLGFFPTSAKENFNIEEAFGTLVAKILENSEKEENRVETRSSPFPEAGEERKSCCT